MKGKVTGQGGLCSDAEVALDVLEDAVAETTGALNIAGLERETQALSRSIRLVHRYVAPPDAAVVPQVVVKVVVIDTKRDLSLLRGHFRKLSVKVKAEFYTLQMGPRSFLNRLAAPPGLAICLVDAGGSRSVQKKQRNL